MAIQFFFFENEVVWLFLGNNHLFKKVHFTIVVVVIKHLYIWKWS